MNPKSNTGPAAFHVIIFVRIAPAHEGATKKEIIVALDAGPAGVCLSGCFFDYIAGGAFAAPGTPATYAGPNLGPGTPELLPGRYAYFCPVPTDGTPHYELKMFGTFRAE